MCLFDTAHFEFLIEIFKNVCNVPCLTLHCDEKFLELRMFIVSLDPQCIFMLLFPKPAVCYCIFLSFEVLKLHEIILGRSHTQRPVFHSRGCTRKRIRGSCFLPARRRYCWATLCNCSRSTLLKTCSLSPGNVKESSEEFFAISKIMVACFAETSVVVKPTLLNLNSITILKCKNHEFFHEAKYESLFVFILCSF